jgi:mycoredoxin
MTAIESNPSESEANDPVASAPAAAPVTTMYTTSWCGFCARLKRGLAAEGIKYTEVNIEEVEGAADLVMAHNGGNRTVPTLVFADGSALTNPSVADVKERLARTA